VNVRVNGEPHLLRDGATVAEVVHTLVESAERGVAVALDGDVVPQSEWAATALADGQQVEVLRAVQGG
jgi:sulfur carrier protein